MEEGTEDQQAQENEEAEGYEEWDQTEEQDPNAQYWYDPNAAYEEGGDPNAQWDQYGQYDAYGQWIPNAQYGQGYDAYGQQQWDPYAQQYQDPYAQQQYQQQQWDPYQQQQQQQQQQWDPYAQQYQQWDPYAQQYQDPYAQQYQRASGQGQPWLAPTDYGQVAGPPGGWDPYKSARVNAQTRSRSEQPRRPERKTRTIEIEAHFPVKRHASTHKDQHSSKEKEKRHKHHSHSSHRKKHVCDKHKRDRQCPLCEKHRQEVLEPPPSEIEVRQTTKARSVPEWQHFDVAAAATAAVNPRLECPAKQKKYDVVVHGPHINCTSDRCILQPIIVPVSRARPSCCPLAPPRRRGFLFY